MAGAGTGSDIGAGTKYPRSRLARCRRDRRETMSDASSQPRRQSHIVVVDGNRRAREDMKAYLAREGYRVTALGAGSEVNALIADRPDLVIICLPLPDMLNLMHSLRGLRGTATIVLSDKDDVADRVAGLEIGADDYLPKSLHRRELLARIRSMLR
ncbi:MAG: response regulator transcription factor, partial [Alphaproteobacteria bacterium]